MIDEQLRTELLALVDQYGAAAVVDAVESMGYSVHVDLELEPVRCTICGMPYPPQLRPAGGTCVDCDERIDARSDHSDQPGR
jgi:hypothetical protein